MIKEYGKEHSEVIMLLHGGGLSWWNYRKAAQLLSDEYRVVLPVLDGHAESGCDFESIERCAQRLIDYIDSELGGSVLALGGVSLGGQIAAQMLSMRGDISRFAVLESAAVIPDRLTGALIGPSVSASFGLISKRWFAKMQADYLRLDKSLFEEYFIDTCKISKKDMIAFMKASATYAPPFGLSAVTAKVRVVAGEKEQKRVLRSAKRLNAMIGGSELCIMNGLRHGEYSMNCPEIFAKDLKALIKGEPTHV